MTDLAEARSLAASLVLAPTPASWVSAALADRATLLLDHAECEKKAAANALALLHRHSSTTWLCMQLSRFAREELRHYEMVLAFCRKEGIAGRPPSAARYGAALKQWVRRDEPGRLLDSLLVAAIIEARSLERFAALVSATDDERLASFYGKLLASEARHARGYLTLAERADSGDELASRWADLQSYEQPLIDAADSVLRFHSGRPDWVVDASSGTSAVLPDGVTRSTTPAGDHAPRT